eukprot:CAMPEP_0182505296 /NCGR_PEP_ID=MMETSP1321-20130603/18962_1 /TAXON_ID=91990 /ORGANISM="Bolidomonas sp., Strain RCC1657" /LENGTH=81 /DNA_ID=CAMNT_0024710813 /DNA_START=46 /DNA_END=287 /DNA_ORIENTATION=-
MTCKKLSDGPGINRGFCWGRRGHGLEFNYCRGQRSRMKRVGRRDVFLGNGALAKRDLQQDRLVKGGAGVGSAGTAILVAVV